MFKYVISLLLSFFFLAFSVNADNAEEKFNIKLIENYDFSQYPYLESRDDPGIFFDFYFDKDKKIIKIKRDKNGYPIVRFSLFEKDIYPGNIVININEIDLSKLKDDEDLNDLIKKNQNIKVKLKNGKTFDLKHTNYKYDNIKLSNYFLNSVNNIDTTRGILEISFSSTLTNKRPDLDFYAKNILGDYYYNFYEELKDLGFTIPIEQVVFDEYKIDVDIRDQFPAYFSYDYGSVMTVMEDEGVGQFRQKFDFASFPFDEQKLKIKIIGLESNSNPDLNWPKGNASVFFITPNIGPFLSLENFKTNNLLKELGWRVISTDIVSDLVITKDYFDVHENKIYDQYKNTIDLVIHVKRNYAHYMFKIIIPVFLILCVAWSVLWIPTKKYEARLNTSIVALLALIAYNFSFTDDIPKLNYLTDLDRFIFLSYIFCCLPTFMSVGFSRFVLRTNELQKRVTVINRHVRKWGGILYLFLVLSIFDLF